MMRIEYILQRRWCYTLTHQSSELGDGNTFIFSINPGKLIGYLCIDEKSETLEAAVIQCLEMQSVKEGIYVIEVNIKVLLSWDKRNKITVSSYCYFIISFSQQVVIKQNVFDSFMRVEVEHTTDFLCT